MTDPNPADSTRGKAQDLKSSSDDKPGDGKLFRRSRVVVKEIGEQTKKKHHWHVTLLRHKRFDTVRIQSRHTIVRGS